MAHADPRQPQPGDAFAASASARAWPWLLPGLLTLIVVRGLLVSGDPTEFPLDRNMTSTYRIRGFIEALANAGWSPKPFVQRRILTPEYPFLPIGAWMLTRMGIAPVIAGRLFSLAAAVLTGLGLFVLGRRLGPPLLGHLALWIYALNPHAIFMGRSLIPDTFMMAAVVWSLIAAGAATQDARPRRVLWLTLWLAVAALAKLPAVLFAPAAALALIESRGLRRREGWIAAAIVAAVVYGVVCAWYRLHPFRPLAGLRELSESTNHLMVSLGDLWSDDARKVFGSRLLLALTLPGAALALLGWVVLQTRATDRLWLNAWILLSLLAVGLTLKANTYWCHMVTPVGCLVAAAGVTALARFGRPALVATGLLVPIGLLADPAHGVVLRDLATRPRAPEMQRMLAGRVDGPVAYYGWSADEMRFLAGLPGLKIATYDDLQWQRNALRSFRYLLSGDLAGGDLLFQSFDSRPVLATFGQAFILFGNAPEFRLGEPVATDGTTLPLSLRLTPELQLRRCEVAPRRLTGPAELTIDMTYERGQGAPAPVPLALDFLNRTNGEAFPLAPIEGGAYFMPWSMPQIQTPNFTTAPVEQVRHRYAIDDSLPDGVYDLRLRVLADRRRALVQGEPVIVPDAFVIERPASGAALPHRFDLGRALWLPPVPVQQADWLGGQRTLYKLGSVGQTWLHADLPAGDCILAITGRPLPIGDGGGSQWPRIRIQQAPGAKPAPPLAFDRSGTMTVACPIHWGGRSDFLRLRIENPMGLSAVPPTFPLYLGSTIHGDRAVLIESIELREARP